MKILKFLSIGVLLLTGCERLSSMPYLPKQTADTWLKMQPFVNLKIGSSHFILTQPSSTILIYLLGFITLTAGAIVFHHRGIHKSRTWWAIALLLWGIGAFFAGTSYQAFGYQIKCLGRDLCSWTSWWEIAYMLVTVASVNAMLVAGAYSSATGRLRKSMIAYGLFNISLYIVVIALGVILLNRFMISFELLLIFCGPNILFLFIQNLIRSSKTNQKLDRFLRAAWIWLGMTIIAYYLYLTLGYSEKLWERGIWFHANDVLHVGLIIWMVFLSINISRRMVDLPINES
ncbi:MAG: hypothetical protein NTZ74_04490 [Chloroflexi bacterium]|nr:hypothetical protein [Chloroflexota bacterium]